jgi:signal transduction histidine kinase
MKNALALLFFVSLFFSNCYSQSLSKSKENSIDATWDQGVPLCPEDPYIMSLIDKIGYSNLISDEKIVTKGDAKLCREIGIAFYNRGMYDAADWYLTRVKGYVEVQGIDLEVVNLQEAREEIKEEVKKEFEKEDPEEVMPAEVAASLAKDKEFLESMPKSFDNISPADMKDLANKIEQQLQKLIKEKEELIKNNASKEVIDAKDAAINTLGKEKKIIDLSIENGDLEVEVVDLEVDKKKLKNYLIWAIISVIASILGIITLLQRKTIRVKDGEIEKQLQDINKKNTYLEYAARIIRHDMHSGINTYMPRGLSSLQKRIDKEKIDELKIGPSLKMISEGLAHTQKVYKNVYEFTNLVKVKQDFSTKETDLKESLERYLSNTSYGKQVILEDLGTLNINEQLFCNAIDNLIKNGLKYNEENDKCVKIYKEVNVIVVEDNGIGLTPKNFEKLIKKGIDTESDTGIGLSITKAIVEEHGFSISCENFGSGTKMKIKVKND